MRSIEPPCWATWTQQWARGCDLFSTCRPHGTPARSLGRRTALLSGWAGVLPPKPGVLGAPRSFGSARLLLISDWLRCCPGTRRAAGPALSQRGVSGHSGCDPPAFRVGDLLPHVPSLVWTLPSALVPRRRLSTRRRRRIW